MPTRIVTAIPVVPGKEGRVEAFGQEIAAHIEEFARLNADAGVTWFEVRLQDLPTGPVAVYAFETEDPSKLRTSFTDSPYDGWWLGYFKDVHGVDLAALPPEAMAPPPTAFAWEGRA